MNYNIFWLLLSDMLWDSVAYILETGQDKHME